LGEIKDSKPMVILSQSAEALNSDSTIPRRQFARETFDARRTIAISKICCHRNDVFPTSQ
jgi:hypothetical protein